MPFPMKRVVLSTGALAVVAGPSIVAANAATRQGHTSVKTSGVDSTPDNEHDTRSASLWFSRAIDAHRGQWAWAAGGEDHGGNSPEAEHDGVTTSTGPAGSGDEGRGSDDGDDDSTTTSDDPTTVTTRSTTTTTGGSSPTTRSSTSTTRATTSTTRWTWPWTTTTRPTTTTTGATTTTTAGGTTTTTRATTTTTRATTTSTAPTTTTTTRAAATIRLSQSFLATAIGNPIQLSTSISNDAATPASITLTINLTTTGDLPGYLNPSSKPAYLSCSPAEIQNPSTTGTFTCTGSVPAATTGAVVISSGSVIIGVAGTPVNATAMAGGVSTSAASTYS